MKKADACVQVIVQENGEHVLLTLGEVHLERCVADLEQRYARVKLNVSKPIVPFRETIVPAATVDMVNEAIVISQDDRVACKSITLQTANRQCKIRLLAVPLDKDIVDLLENSSDILKVSCIKIVLISFVILSSLTLLGLVQNINDGIA